MFGFLKRAAGIVDDYSAGKALEQWYKVAELTTMMYMLRLWSADSNPSAKEFAINLWSYLLSTEPSDPGLRAFGVQHKVEIQSEALRLLANDEPFRKVIVSTLWIGLGICRGQDDKAGFERIVASEIFKLYSATYPILSHDKYAKVVEDWARLYSPPPSPDLSPLSGALEIRLFCAQILKNVMATIRPPLQRLSLSRLLAVCTSLHLEALDLVILSMDSAKR